MRGNISIHYGSAPKTTNKWSTLALGAMIRSILIQNGKYNGSFSIMDESDVEEMLEGGYIQINYQEGGDS